MLNLKCVYYILYMVRSRFHQRKVLLIILRCWRFLLTIHSDPFLPDGPLVLLLSNVVRHSAYELGHHTLGLQTQVTRR